MMAMLSARSGDAVGANESREKECIIFEQMKGPEYTGYGVANAPPPTTFPKKPDIRTCLCERAV